MCPFSGTILAVFLVATFVAVAVDAATTITWTSQADFERGTLAGLDAVSYPGRLLLQGNRTTWSKHFANPVLVPQAAWESDWVGTPSVLYENGTYKMWYVGCAGTQCAIGHATSTDGGIWNRTANPVLVGNATSWDQSLGNPYVIHDGSVYRMWYAGNGPSGIQIGYATSADGVAWSKFVNSPVTVGGRPWDVGSVSTPVVIKQGGMFVLYFSGHPGSFSYSMGRATSWDGYNWTEDPGNPLMVPDAGWEEARVHPSDIVPSFSGYELYYTGGFNFPQIGHATSVDGRNWTKDPANPVVSAGDAASWDRAGVSAPKLITAANETRMYYAGEASSSGWRIGFARYTPGGPIRYRTFGFFLSAVVDSGSSTANWDFLGWSGAAPAVTNLTVGVRVGNTSSPDPSWSILVNVPPGGPVALHLAAARYAQVAATLSTTNASLSPILDDISLEYSIPTARPPPPTVTNPFVLGIVGIILLALVLPVTIVLLLVVLLVVRGRPGPAAPRYPGFFGCPYCGTANPVTNLYCTNCGQPFDGPHR